MKNCKGFGRKWSWPNLNMLPAFIWRELGKPGKCIQLAVVTTGIRTRYFLTQVHNVATTPTGWVGSL